MNKAKRITVAAIKLTVGFTLYTGVFYVAVNILPVIFLATIAVEVIARFKELFSSAFVDTAISIGKDALGACSGVLIAMVAYPLVFCINSAIELKSVLTGQAKHEVTAEEIMQTAATA